MATHLQLLESFYTAFQHRDYAEMAACYHRDIHFSDPVFADLRSTQAKAMWHMLCERGKDLQVTFSDVQADEGRGQARWEARYTFSTGRKVHNIIEATFVFRDGKIIQHQDHFDLWRWTRMALGPMGWFLGWSSVVQNRVRETAVASLNKFVANHPEYQ